MMRDKVSYPYKIMSKITVLYKRKGKAIPVTGRGGP
jgi:hypothetical protein